MDRSLTARAFSPVVLEQLEQRLAPATSIFEDQVTNLYHFALNRNPEAGGLQAHVRSLESGTPLQTVAGAIFSSEEHQRSLISSYYRVFLDRNPDTAGLNSLVAAARNGASSEQILATFLSAPEYVGNSSDGDETFVHFLYQQVLNRAGDEAGIASHVEALKNGASPFDVALAFLESKENESTEIRALYQNILGRFPSDNEVEGWVKQLARPEVDLQDGVVAFLSSPEGARRIGADLVFDIESQDNAWFMDDVGQHSLTVRTLGGPSADQQLVLKLLNQIRAVETFSNPENPGQIFEQLEPGKYPDIDKLNNNKVPTTGTFGASAYPGDLRNTPGAFQVDLANIGKKNEYNKDIEVFGEWAGTAGAPKNPNSNDVEIAFTRETLQAFLGISIDDKGLITSITRESAAVFLGNESIALDPGFLPTANPLIGQHVDSLKREQLSLYLAGRVAQESTVGLNDPRVAPQGVVDTALGLQYQTSQSYIYAVLATYAKNDAYKETFAKAKQLFGSTLQITSSQNAFGAKKGQVFWSKFNSAFITGGAYVSGINAMFSLIQGLVDADEKGSGTWEIKQTDAGGLPLPSILINFKKVVDSDSPVGKVFTVDKTPTNVDETYPTIFHYGAVMSPIEIDHLLDNPAAWGVTGRDGTMGYSRLSATQTQTGTGTLPSGAGAYTYQYKGLEEAKTLTVLGGDSYKIVPVPAALAEVVTVDNTGYNVGPNNSQVAPPNAKIDMSAYGVNMDTAYPSMFYVDTKYPTSVAHVSDQSFKRTTTGLYLYYLPGVTSAEKALEVILNGDFSQWSDYFRSYRVNVASTEIFGNPTSAADFAQHFIMTPPPLPPQGSGVIDANGLTGSLHVATDTSVTKVYLGSGANTVNSGSRSAGIHYVLNAGMAPDAATTVFSKLQLGTDMVDLTGFGTVTNLAANVVASFDNKVGSAPTAKLYPQYTDTMEVSFTSGGKSFKFLVLVAGGTKASPTNLANSVLSSVVA